MVCFDGVVVGGLVLIALIAELFIWVFIFTGGNKGPHSYIDMIVPPRPNSTTKNPHKREQEPHIPLAPPIEHKWEFFCFKGEMLAKKPISTFEREYCTAPMKEEPKPSKKNRNKQ